MDPRTDDQPVGELSARPNDSNLPQPHPSATRTQGPSIVAGVIGFLLIMVAGAVIVLSQSQQYSATTTLVVLPDQSIGLDAASNYYDTLSHGQIAATASHILALKQFKSAADSQLGLSPANDAATKIQVTVEAGTSLLTVSADAPTGAIAERLADTVVSQATFAVNSLIVPYRLSIVSSATNTAQSSSNLSLGKFLAVLVIVGVACAIGIQQAYNQLVSLRRRRPIRPAPAAHLPGSKGPVGSSGGGSAGTEESETGESPGASRRSKFPEAPVVGTVRIRQPRGQAGRSSPGAQGDPMGNGGGERGPAAP